MKYNTVTPVYLITYENTYNTAVLEMYVYGKSALRKIQQEFIEKGYTITDIWELK